MIGDRGLKEEAEVGEDWAHVLIIDLHPCEKFAEDDHIDHQWNGKERVLTDVVGGNSINSVHEDGAGILIQSPLGVLNKWNILDNDLMINLVISLWVENRVRFDSIIKDSSFGDFFGLEAFVLLQIFSVIVSKMVVGNDRRKSDS